MVSLKGSTTSEQNEIRDKIVDGMNAVKNAAIKGILPGGGSSLLHATKILDEMRGDTVDETMGIKTLSKALKEPFIAIADNCGLNGNYYAQKTIQASNWKYGLCLKTKKIIDLVEDGVT